MLSDKTKAYRKKWVKDHPEKRREYAKKWRDKNIEKVRQLYRNWYANNPKKKIASNARYLAKNINARIAFNLRVRTRKALERNSKTGSGVRDLGCSIDELKVYLTERFQHNMSWDNYGKWHIDHIIPLSAFDLTNREEFELACHYTNLQPLWAKDNLFKGDKYEK